MKNIAKVLILVLIVSMVFALVGCITPTADTEGTMTLVVGEKEYTVDLSKVKVEKGLISILDYLKENEGLVYEATYSEYGAMLTKVNELEQDYTTNTYLYIYTTVQKDADVSEYAETKEYKGTTLTSAGVGASSMSLEKDCIILISTMTYSF